MQCPECHSDNRQEAKFCSECGRKFELVCLGCGNSINAHSKFCDECGCKLSFPSKATDTTTEPDCPPQQTPEKIEHGDVAISVGERKHVTVLFSDLTGYTAMSEKLDPEDVKEITSRIFGDIAKIVASYDGFIEKYAGDAVMAIFGVPQAHEDDPIRAIKAAREIHHAVDIFSPKVKEKTGQAIAMHTGINTGLVVTGEVNLERGTHGVAGDTINLAARLSSMAKPGEILVNVDTCRQVEGYFECAFHEEASVKGKAELVEVHKVLSEREAPVTIRRLSGVRADLVGRTVEMAELSEAVEKLAQGKGRIFSICGAAGTGKSRLVEEFKAGLDLEKTQWIECHAYAYSQEIPYFPLVDLLNRLLQIDEKDSPSRIREKIESRLTKLVGKRDEIIPYVGGLYSLSYPQTEDVSPEFWKTRLQEAILAILSKLAETAPTVFFIEDLHWADPSFVELLRRACVEIRTPALLLCAYRPTFSLFTGHQLNSIGDTYHEIKLENLSLTTAQHLLASLLKTDNIPLDLKRWVNSKAEGNPFYLEELINSLIESGTLTSDNGHWQLTRPLTKADIPSSLHGLINGRLDRLEKMTKRVLQEASVIGRDFLYEILKRITELEERIDGELYQLERLDLIRTRTLQPEIEYMFKHALTQEVVYHSLLKKERRGIHEKIAQVIETVFKDRLVEFNETLAYHFARGQSNLKAIQYLMKAGEKCLKRYALEEAHGHYQAGYDLLSRKSKKTLEEKSYIIAILVEWALVFYYRGFFGTLSDLLVNNEEVASNIEDKNVMGMYYAWLGFTLDNRFRAKEAYGYLQKSLKIGEEINDEYVIGYACTWLTWTCSSLGLYDEALTYGNRAQSIAHRTQSDHYIHFKSLAGMGLTYFFKGEAKKAIEAGQEILKYGQDRSNIRSQAIGYYMIGYGHCAGGNFKKSIASSEKAIQIALDPFYKVIPNNVIGLCHIFNKRYTAAKKHFEEVKSFGENRGFELLGIPSGAALAAISIAEGQMTAGLRKLKEIQNTCFKQQYRGFWLIIELIIGQIYAEMIFGPRPRAGIIMRNIGFLIKHVPFAEKRAEAHLKNAIEIAQEIEANGTLGQAYYSLGMLYKTKKENRQAEEWLLKAIDTFRKCGADGYTHQALEAIESLG